MEEPEEEEEGYELAMPLVCCKTNGGALDDTAFSAGVTFGQYMAELRERPAVWAEYVIPEVVAQYDLLAMQEGYTMVATPWDEHPDEWVFVVMTRDSDA